MDLLRIGGKIVSRRKINRLIDRILEMRSSGASQQKIADRLEVDRTFISRLETLGEVRKGNRIAVIGFPIKNKEEILELLQKEGIEFTMIMTERERWGFVENVEGIDLLNRLTGLIVEARTYDVVLVIGSNHRIEMIEAVLDKEVIGLEIGESPIEEDCYVDPEQVLQLLHVIRKQAVEEVAR